jgi:hypothetical protein
MKTKLLYITIISQILIQACKRNESPCSNYTSKSYKFLLADSTKAQIPYTGNETLMFISNQGDTAILTGQGKNDYILNSTVNVGNDPACPKYDDYSFEYVDCEYKGNNENLFHVFYTLYIDKWGDEYTNIILNDIYSKYKAYTGYYNDTSRYSNQIDIGNNRVGGIIIEGDNNTDPTFTYNKSYGIIQIKIDSNLIYTLNQ